MTPPASGDRTAPALGVRASATLAATVMVALALIGTFVILVGGLRSSLIDEVDRSLVARADDLLSQIEASEIAFDPTATGPSTTFAAVLDNDDVVLAASDCAAFDLDLVGSLSVSGDPATVALPALTATSGAERLRIFGLSTTAELFGVVSQCGVEDVVSVPDGAASVTVIVGASLEGVDRTVRRATLAALAAVPLLTLLVSLVTWLVAGRALRPVEQMRVEVDEITATDLHRRVARPVADDAIGRLATTMNQMLERLEVGNERQRRFVADASHELRSPIASIRAQLEVSSVHPELTDWPLVAASIDESSARLETLIDDLLLLARSDDGRLSLRRDLLDLDEIVRSEATSAGRRALRPIDTRQVAAALVRGDEVHLRRVVTNLIDNAITHGGAAPSIAVGTAEQANAVVLWVEDDGPGIEPTSRERVFDRFARLDEARTSGRGLGLAICREIVRGHGGTIEVGDRPGGGARLVVRLPSPESPTS